MEIGTALCYTEGKSNFPGGIIMHLGEKLLACRLEQGLTQRQLCEGIVTRNMLSRIEHGAARPSMDTLRQLAARLGRPMAYFLEEESLSSLDEARQLYRNGAFREALTLLRDSPAPEGRLLHALCRLALAEEAISANRIPYARELLEAPMEDVYLARELERRRILLLARLPGADVTALAAALPGPDGELMLLSRAQEDPHQAGALLDAVRDRGDDWYLLRGKCYMAAGDYSAALTCLQPLEGTPAALPLLEACARELGDFQLAYRYAVMGR